MTDNLPVLQTFDDQLKTLNVLVYHKDFEAKDGKVVRLSLFDVYASAIHLIFRHNEQKCVG